MALVITPAPTYADVVLVDPATQKGKFNPIWLKWFLDLSSQVNTSAGSVTSVAQTFTGGLISVSGSPITTTGTLALTVAGTSGGVPYFSGATTWASSAALAAGGLVVGGGAGVAPSTVAAGATTQILVGGGAGTAPVWTTATGTGAPARAGSPTFTGTLGAANGEFSSTLRVSGIGAPVSGSGVETSFSAGEGYLFAFDRSGSVFLPMHVRGSTVSLNIGNTEKLSIDAAGAVTIPGTITNSVLTAGRVPFIGTAGLITDDAAFTFTTSTGTLTLSKSYAGAKVLVNDNTSTDAAAQSVFSFLCGAQGLVLVQNSQNYVGALGKTLIYSDGVGGIDMYTAAATALRFGTNSTLTDLVIDTSHNVVLSTALRLTETGGGSDYVGFKAPAAITASATYTLPSADGTKGYALHTNGSAIMSWQDAGGISVVIYGADPTGSADSLSAIQAAIDAVGTSGHVYFPPGTYKITNAIRIGSNIKMSGAGYASQISYAGTGGVTVNWVNGGGSGTEYFMVLNENGHQRSGTVDTNIEICHLRFTYTSGTQPHGCFFMNTTDCSVHHCYTDGGPDTCAFLKSKYYRVTNNYNNGCINCAYDNWDGPSHAVIADNVAVVGNGGSGIFVNGVSTDTTTPVNNDGFNIVVANNTIVAGHTGCLQGIYISGLNATSTVKFVAVTGNTIKSDGSNVFTRGIDIREGNYVAVTGNTVVGPCSLNGIEIVSNYNSITGNIVTGVNGVGDYGIEVTGDYNMFAGNVLQGNTANFNDTGTGNQNTSNTAGTNTINIVQ